MAKIRVYELAKQLNTTNKELLAKLKEIDIPVKSHMSVLDEDTVTEIKEAILGRSSEIVTEKRVKSTVIRRRRKVVEEKPPAEVEIPTGIKEEAPGAIADQTHPAVAGKPSEEDVAGVAAPEVAMTEAAPEGVGVKVEPLLKKPATEVRGKKKHRQPKETPAKIIKMPEAKPSVLVAPEKESGTVPFVEEGSPAHLKVVQIDADTGEPVAKGKAKKRGRKKAEADEEVSFPKKKAAFRKKEIIDKSDLYDEQTLRTRKDRRPRKGKVAVRGEKTLITTPKAIKRRVKIDQSIGVADLAKRMGVKAAEVIKELMALGVMASLNQTIDFDTAAVVATEFNYEAEKTSFEEAAMIAAARDDPEKLKPRPPVVTIMGHVDHGKTSLLDAIRQTNVTDDEAGGITQHIGAYNVNLKNGRIVFLDTPGHEAFTAMRARGAEITDLVVLVVAADDGVMPQTLEAINHSRAADVPIMVAVNKIDKQNADTEKARRQLAEQGLSPEEWGGDTVFVNVSAKKGDGIDHLLEMILLQAEVMELKANPDKLAVGHVVEAKLDPGRGAVATVLVQEGTLRSGDAVMCGIHYGKIRAMIDDRGEPIDAAGPSMPVEIHGLSGVPMAGDDFMALADEKVAKQISSHRTQKQRGRDLAKSSGLTLEKYHERMQRAPVKDLNLIIRADVQGSVEALAEATTKITSTDVKVNIVHSATGAITESDVMLAAVTNAIVVGFNVRPNAKVRDLAAEQNVDIRFYDVIYNVVHEIKTAVAGLVEPTYKERVVGRAEVRETFAISKVGTIAGCHVVEGKIERAKAVRLLRDDVVVYTGKMSSLRRFKDDVKEVQSGYECGVGIENYNDVKVGDVIECYEMEEIKPVIE